MGAFDDRLIVAATLDIAEQDLIANWASHVRWPVGTKRKDPSRYHATLLFCQTGKHRQGIQEWIEQYHSRQFILQASGFLLFTNPGHMANNPIVLQFDSPSLTDFSDQLHEEAEQRGLVPVRYSDRLNIHVTVAEGPGLPAVPWPIQLNLTTHSVSMWD